MIMETIPGSQEQESQEKSTWNQYGISLCKLAPVHPFLSPYLQSFLFFHLVFVFILSEVKVPQLCPTLIDRMDYIVHGILQTRILQWVAFPFFRKSSNLGIQPRSY